MQTNTATTSLDPAKMTPIVNRIGNPAISPMKPDTQYLGGTPVQPGTGGGLMNVQSQTGTQTPTQSQTQPQAQTNPLTRTGAQTSSTSPVTGAPNYTVPMPQPPKNSFTPEPYKPVTGDALANAPQGSFQGGNLQQNGFGGVTSDKQYQYDPRTESLVQNQMAGLMDPNSALMRKAIAQGNSMAASRGLQSSSIGQEIALSTMIDKALPIAQQDAQTYNQAQSQQWQTQAQLDQTNLKHQQDAQMVDKQADYQNQMQDKQMLFQQELKQLEYKQSLGMLDAQGAQRMQELNAQIGAQNAENNTNREFQQQMQDLQYRQNLSSMDKQAALQADRDAILQQYQKELNVLQNDQRWKELTAQLDQDMAKQAAALSGQAKLDYGNSISSSVNAAMQAIGMAMSNPNMTQAQQQAAVQQIITSLQAQTNVLATVYGATAPTQPTQPTTPPTGITNPTNPLPGGTGSSGAGTGTGTGGSTGGGYAPGSPDRYIDARFGRDLQ